MKKANEKVWKECAYFIRKSKGYFNTSLDNALEANDSELADEIKSIVNKINAACLGKHRLDYFNLMSCIEFKVNRKRVDIVKVIAKIQDEFSNLLAKHSDKIDPQKAQEFINNATKLLAKAESGAIVKNRINFKWLYDKPKKRSKK